jgi:type II secretory ATPase GspE/PulE/Tfp pilus assembly ATPase PilB-like protein
MDVTEEIQTLITKQATSGEIERMAIAQGMVTMRNRFTVFAGRIIRTF